MSAPTEITLSLDLDQYIANHVGYDPAGEPVSQSATVEDLILDLAAEKMLHRAVLKNSDDTYGGLRKRIADLRDALIDEQLAPLVTEALNGEFRKTNSYGEPTGEPTTLRDEIARQVNAWLTTKAGDSYNRTGLTRLQQIVAAEVDKAMVKDLSGVIAAAKAEVTAAVQAKGAEVLAQTITAMAGVK
jgi:hypothetical protein